MILQIFGVFFSNLNPANLIHLTFVMHYFYISVRFFPTVSYFMAHFLTDDISFAIPHFLEFRKEISSFAMLII